MSFGRQQTKIDTMKPPPKKAMMRPMPKMSALLQKKGNFKKMNGK